MHAPGSYLLWQIGELNQNKKYVQENRGKWKGEVYEYWLQLCKYLLHQSTNTLREFGMRHMVECNAYNPLFCKIIFYNKVEAVFIGKLGWWDKCKVLG